MDAGDDKNGNDEGMENYQCDDDENGYEKSINKIIFDSLWELFVDCNQIYDISYMRYWYIGISYWSMKV